MDKFKQFGSEYSKLMKQAEPFLGDHPDEFEYYVEKVLLRIWAGNARYSEDYAKAIEAISGKRRSGEEILKAMISGAGEITGPGVPGFFGKMVDDDFKSGSDNTRKFIDGLKSLLVGGAYINGDFTVEESAAVSDEIKRLMTYAIGKGVKIDYATGRIREKTTPPNEESYAREESVEMDNTKFFEALTEGFLRPAQLKKDELTGRLEGNAPDGNPSAGLDPFSAGPDAAGASADQDSKAQDAQKADAPAATTDERTMEELMAELDGLVGLESIKKDIHSLMNFIEITKLRKERGLNVPTISYHLVFTGNPGTGKTTVARLVAGLYRRIGILPKGQLVEVDRGQLVAGYTGQTAIKTMNAIKQALGGVLFIDEAYALVNDDQDSFGKEAVETILKAMEDHRDELVVIVAGYTELMHKFIESNPGFKSRFSKFFEFPDYTGEELMEIFSRFCESNGYHMTEKAGEYLKVELQKMYESRSRHFGNGRTVRNIFEKAIHTQADRLTKCDEKVSDDQLQELTADDVRDAVETERNKFQEIE